MKLNEIVAYAENFQGGVQSFVTMCDVPNQL